MMMGECSQQVSNLMVPFHIIRDNGELGIVQTIYEEFVDELLCRETSSEGSGCSYTDLFNHVGDYEISINLAISDDQSPGADAAIRRPPASSRSCNLQNSIRAWCDATGLPTTVSVHVDGNVFNLHKFPLVSVSGYMKRELMRMDELHLDSKRGCWPGGSESFEVAAGFCYGGRVALTPSNVAAVRCAAEVLEMTEDYVRGNLARRCDIYLRQVALRRWSHALAVLKQCQSLGPLAESLLIVAQCVESIATMACGQAANAVEIHHLQSTTAASVPRFSGQYNNGYSSDVSHNTGFSSIAPLHTIDGSHLRICFCTALLQLSDDQLAWIHELAELPHNYFSQIIAATRRLGMREKHVMYTMLQFAEKSIFSCFEVSEDGELEKKLGKHSARLELRCNAAVNGSECTLEVDDTVQKIGAAVALMKPAMLSRNQEGKGSNRFPLIRFLYALLKCTLACGGEANEYKQIIERMIEARLGQARIGDFELPCSLIGVCRNGEEKARRGYVCNSRRRDMKEVDSVSHIVSLFMSSSVAEEEDMQGDVEAVAQLWDEYMAQLTADQAALSVHRLVELVAVVPPPARRSHDGLYAVIDSFLQAHTNVSQQEREALCNPLNCQKLSKDCCIQVVQNERMPLRIIVQAMFMHQLNSNSNICVSPATTAAKGAASWDAAKLRRSTSCHQHASAKGEHGSDCSTVTEKKRRQQLSSLLKAGDEQPSVDNMEVLHCRLLSLEEEIHHLKHSLAGYSFQNFGQARPSNAPVSKSRWRRRFSCLGLLRNHATATPPPPPPPPPPHGPSSSVQVTDPPSLACCLDLTLTSPLCPKQFTRSFHSF